MKGVTVAHPIQGNELLPYTTAVPSCLFKGVSLPKPIQGCEFIKAFLRV